MAVHNSILNNPEVFFFFLESQYHMCSIKKNFKYSQSGILIKRSGTVRYSDGGVSDMGERELTNIVCFKPEIDSWFGVS